MLLLAGCLGTSDPHYQQNDGEIVTVDVMSPASFNLLEARLPPSTNNFAVQVTSYPVTYTSYVHEEDVVGHGPLTLSFVALLDNVPVATGEIPSITYTLHDDPETRQSVANLAITLTAVTP